MAIKRFAAFEFHEIFALLLLYIFIFFIYLFYLLRCAAQNRVRQIINHLVFRVVPQS